MTNTNILIHFFPMNNHNMNTNSPPSITMVSQPSSPSPLPPLSKPRATKAAPTALAVPRTMASAANLANLLPTGTVLAFQTLTPSFSNQGTCHLSNKFLTGGLIVFCSLICFLSSFTDSFVDSNGKLYYGIATFKGLFIFNNNDQEDIVDLKEDEEVTISGNIEHEGTTRKDLAKYRLNFIDFIHAFVSLGVFLVFSLSDNNVLNCFFPRGGINLDELVMNLPLAAGLFSSFFFIIFPTTRRGIGYADTPNKHKS